uniref:Lipocalin n=1 Tax=Rhipicephalus appendiculatus TaxID=34631 RepID=A0A131YUH0_RHIAP
MKLYLFGFLSIYALGLVYISPCVKSRRFVPPFLPANNTSDLYLVGYSLNIYNPKISCVRSQYKNKSGYVVSRYLLAEYDDPETKQHISGGFPFNMTIPNETLVFVLNITSVPDNPLAKLMGVRQNYSVLYYNNNTMILGDKKRTNEGKPSCSLWVTPEYRYTQKTLRSLTNIIFNENCANPMLVKYDENCPW